MLNEFLSKVGVDASKIGFAGINLKNLLGGLFFFVVLGLVVGISVFIWIRNKEYNKTIHIFKEINGVTTPVGTDKAREIIIPRTSIRVFHLKKNKVYLARPSYETGKNQYWYFIRRDGEWINVRPENLNKKMDELGLFFDHTDMRLINENLKSLIDSNWGGQSFWQKYAQYIAVGILTLLLFIGGFIYMYQASKVTKMQASSIEKMDHVVDKVNNLLEHANRIQTGSLAVQSSGGTTNLQISSGNSGSGG